MQRWLFFIFCILSQVVCAQGVDVLRAEISMYKQGIHAASGASKLKARASYLIKTVEGKDRVQLKALGMEVERVRLRQGRLKNFLTYSLQGDTLTIHLPGTSSGQITMIDVEYVIDLAHPDTELYVQRGAQVLALNPMNASIAKPLGKAGMFFPAIAGDVLELKLNVSTGAEENVGFPGREEYRVNFAGGTAHFWTTEKPILPEAFYVIIGTFEEFDAEELEEEFMLGEIVLKQLKFEKSKRAVAPYMELYGLASDAVSDSEYAIIDSLSRQDFSGFFITPQDVPGHNIEQYQKEAAIAYYLEGEVEARASERHELAHRQKKGAKWYETVMQDKWNKREQLSSVHQDKVMAYRLNKYQQSNAKWMEAISTTELDTALIKPMMESRKLINLRVNYRYVAGDTVLYISYVQDTATAPVYHFPLRVAMVSGAMADTAYRIIRQPQGVLKIPFAKVPNMAAVDGGKYFPGAIEDNRPDTYNLYQLSNAKGPADRKEALRGLFKTSNPNLFSTALGIAMDDEDAAIRKLALDNATALNAAAQRKLRATLVHLSQHDPDADIRQKASVLVSKYYEIK